MCQISRGLGEPRAGEVAVDMLVDGAEGGRKFCGRLGLSGEQGCNRRLCSLV